VLQGSEHVFEQAGQAVNDGETDFGASRTTRHDRRMEMSAVMAAVEAAFDRIADGLERWDDPHPPPDRIVADEEYSRVTNAEKWRIVGARADAWIDALVALGVATVERDADPRWVESPPSAITGTDVVHPTVADGVPLVISRSRIEAIEDAGVTLGVGDPAVRITFIPDCGCDACDSGSQDVIDQLDSYVRPVVSGELRLLRRGRQSVMVLEDGCRQGHNIGMGGGDPILTGRFRFLRASRQSAATLRGNRLQGWSVAPGRAGRTRDRMSEILADPTGWDEVSGPSWLTGARRDVRQ
jgi:hypothetical protein